MDQNKKENFPYSGEMNRGVYVDPKLLSPVEKEKYDEGYKRNGFNQYVSDMISIRRRMPDVRDPQ